MNKIIMIICVLTFNSDLSGQGINNIWLLGYNGFSGSPYGNTELNFISGLPAINALQLEMEFGHTHTNISDNQGNLLLYTNGYYIADATNDTMSNGSGINPSNYTNSFSDGLLIPQGSLVIPKPGSNNIYYLFHSTIDNYPTGGAGTYSFYFYLTTIDISLNNGKGEVIQKNQVLINDSLNTGKITATKHANGRDWWIVIHKAKSSIYYKLLITPYNIIGPFTQSIGTYRDWDVGQAKFSPDGTKYAYYYRNTPLDILDFDRCTGDFSNPVTINLPVPPGFNVGLEFSPDSKVLYVTNVTQVFQYNLDDPDVASTEIIVADWDTFYSPFPPFGTYLCLSQLAPDGKIYISTGNSTFHLHRINYPDSIGIACDVDQHSVQLPAYYFNTLPNHPNYFLGADSGSVCDTIVTTVDIFEPPEIKIKIFPNPNNGVFTLGFPAQKEQGVLEIYDVLGNLILKENVAQWSQYKRVHIENVNTGIYLCKITWGDKSANVKIMKE